MPTSVTIYFAVFDGTAEQDDDIANLGGSVELTLDPTLEDAMLMKALGALMSMEEVECLHFERSKARTKILLLLYVNSEQYEEWHGTLKNSLHARLSQAMGRPVDLRKREDPPM